MVNGSDSSDSLYVSEKVGIAANRAIKEVHETSSGVIIDAERVLPRDSETLHRQRREIERARQEGHPLYLCAYCAKPIYLALESRKKRSGLHYRHYEGDGDCIARTRSGKTKEQLEALKYDGLKEGALHRETKELLVASLSADADFSDIQTEKRWKEKNGAKWRQPDVRAQFQGKPVAFEIQLATTFLSVIEARSQFYRREAARLVWVFRSFHTENRPAAVDDIYFGNNRNAFVVSPATCDASQKSNKATLMCYWPQPELRGNELVEVWKNQLVAFSEIESDADGREWFYDCDGERKRLRLQILKRQIRDYCEGYKALSWDERSVRWSELDHSASLLNFSLGEISGEDRFIKLMGALFSLEEGQCLGFGFRALVSIAHLIYDKHKPLLFYFMHAENAFGRREQLLRAGKLNAWRNRRNEAKLQMSRPGAFKPNRTHDALVRALFPEVDAEIKQAKQIKKSS